VLAYTPSTSPPAASVVDWAAGPVKGDTVPKSSGSRALWGTLGAVWGLGGVMVILGSAVVRLLPVGWAPLAAGVDGVTALAYAASLAFFGYTEGYRAFHRNFCPRVAARAQHLAEHPTPARVAAAPLFCMGYFGATRRRLAVSYGVTLGVIGIIAVVRGLAQPWRGAIDLGVCFALAWGAAAIPYFYLRGAGTARMPVSADVPQLPAA
jgi:hypothetical protein